MGRKRYKKIISDQRGGASKTKKVGRKEKSAMPKGERYLHGQKQDQLGVVSGILNAQIKRGGAKVERLVAEYELAEARVVQAEEEMDRFGEEHAGVWKEYERFEAEGYPDGAEWKRFEAEMNRVCVEEKRYSDELCKCMKDEERLMVAVYDELKKEMSLEGEAHRYDKEMDEFRANIEMYRVMLRLFKENEDQIDAVWKRRRKQILSKNAE